ncbi:hypothetical protein M747DRAFT_15521 [Aspergillus niger ATCC 13496]|uniref:Uncharacterized protein n=1 Tax=Aspergillus niger ATCC 13496 TaxID=1353008 RepID=A0A370C5E0_ASPNG|nr:hypothetical protein M747DRAFT_15521 [Aspergillus niger ATCC 13496]
MNTDPTCTGSRSHGRSPRCHGPSFGNGSLEVDRVVILGHVLATVDAEDAHAWLVSQSAEQLGRDQEVLAAAAGFRRGAGYIDQTAVDHALISGIHTLVNFVDHAEGRCGERLEGHEVKDGADGAFTTGLAVRVQQGKVFVFAEFDVDLNRPLVEIAVTWFAVRTSLFGLVQGDLAGAADAGERVGEGVADALDDRVELGFPPAADFVDGVVVVVELFLEVGEFVTQLVDLTSTFFEFFDHVAVSAVGEFETSLFGVNIGLELLHCLILDGM